jgi:stress response protein SCP2
MAVVMFMGVTVFWRKIKDEIKKLLFWNTMQRTQGYDQISKLQVKFYTNQNFSGQILAYYYIGWSITDTKC